MLQASKRTGEYREAEGDTTPHPPPYPRYDRFQGLRRRRLSGTSALGHSGPFLVHLSKYSAYAMRSKL